MKAERFFILILSVVSSLGANASTAPWFAPQSIQIQVTGTEATANPLQTQSNVADVSFIIKRSQIENRKFIYALELQYGTQDQAQFSTLPQGTIPIRFKISYPDLLLVVDHEVSPDPFTSSPPPNADEVISRFKILAQTDQELVVAGARSSEMIVFNLQPQLTVTKNWIRDLHQEEDGVFLLQESSIRLSNDVLIEVLEDIFPAERFGAEKDFQIIPIDPAFDTGNGSDTPNPIQGRYNFITGSTIFIQGKKAVLASHFDLTPTAENPTPTIDYYAAPGFPEKYLQMAGSAVEGFNRYFEKMDGIRRKVIRFMGPAPAGIIVGDPHYNLINYSTCEGGAAAGPDIMPETGRIIRTGINFCSRELDDALKEAQGKMLTDLNLDPSQMDQKALETALASYKATLFHEAGHSLGFEHNRKSGSGFDLELPISDTNLPATSALHELPDDFAGWLYGWSATSSDGPILEWDRQMISVLYHHGSDVDFSKPAVPVCNSPYGYLIETSQGLDPLCNGLEVGKDPTKMLDIAFGRVELSVYPGWVTLSQTLPNIARLILTADRIQSIQSADDWTKAEGDWLDRVHQAINYFYHDSGMGALRATKYNIRNIKKYLPNTLVPGPGPGPGPGNDSTAMHARVFSAIDKLVHLTALPDHLKADAVSALTSAFASLKKSPYIQSLSQSQQVALWMEFQQELDRRLSSIETTEEGLSAIRTKILSNLAKTQAPYDVDPSIQPPVDYFMKVLALLSESVQYSDTRLPQERVAAATSLKTYSDHGAAQSAIADLVVRLNQEKASTTDPDHLKLVDQLLAILSGS